MAKKTFDPDAFLADWPAAKAQPGLAAENKTADPGDIAPGALESIPDAPTERDRLHRARLAEEAEGDLLGTALYKGARGVTLGAADRIVPAMAEGINQVHSYATGNKPIPNVYADTRRQYLEREDALTAANPTTALGAEFGGGVAAQAALGPRAGASPLARTGNMAAQGAVGGALNTREDDPKTMASNALAGGVAGAALNHLVVDPAARAVGNAPTRNEVRLVTDVIKSEEGATPMKDVVPVYKHRDSVRQALEANPDLAKAVRGKAQDASKRVGDIVSGKSVDVPSLNRVIDESAPRFTVGQLRRLLEKLEVTSAGNENQASGVAALREGLEWRAKKWAANQGVKPSDTVRVSIGDLREWATNAVKAEGKTLGALNEGVRREAKAAASQVAHEVYDMQLQKAADKNPVAAAAAEMLRQRNREVAPLMTIKNALDQRAMREELRPYTKALQKESNKLALGGAAALSLTDPKAAALAYAAYKAPSAMETASRIFDETIAAPVMDIVAKGGGAGDVAKWAAKTGIPMSLAQQALNRAVASRSGGKAETPTGGEPTVDQMANFQGMQAQTLGALTNKGGGR